MITVACVLRSGPEYRAAHVAELARGVREHLMLPHRLVCLTDLPAEVEAAGVEAVELPQDWAGWFAKLCLFAPDYLDLPALYLDLDVRVIGPIDDIATGHRFTMCSDFQTPANVNSSFMAWDEDLSRIYEEFARDPAGNARSYRTHGRWGDQDWIAHHTPVKPERWQQKHPGAVVSYKCNIRAEHRHKSEVGNGRVPDGARVVCFHGRPRPWEVGW